MLHAESTIAEHVSRVVSSWMPPGIDGMQFFSMFRKQAQSGRARGSGPSGRCFKSLYRQNRSRFFGSASRDSRVLLTFRDKVTTLRTTLTPQSDSDSRADDSS